MDAHNLKKLSLQSLFFAKVLYPRKNLIKSANFFVFFSFTLYNEKMLTEPQLKVKIEDGAKPLKA